MNIHIEEKSSEKSLEDGNQEKQLQVQPEKKSSEISVEEQIKDASSLLDIVSLTSKEVKKMLSNYADLQKKLKEAEEPGCDDLILDDTILSQKLLKHIFNLRLLLEKTMTMLKRQDVTISF